MKFFFAVSILIFFGVIACDLTTAGGTSEHENVVQALQIPDVRDSVEVVILDSREEPIPFAVVQAVERKNWAAKTEQGLDVIEDSAFVADSVGKFRVEAEHCAEIGLAAKIPEKGLGYKPCSADSSVALVVNPARLASGQSSAHRKIAAYGTGFFVRSDDRGNWRLPLPENLDSDKIVVLEHGFWHPAGERPDRLLVEDFEEDSPFTRLHRFNGGSHWWMAFDSLAAENLEGTLAEHREYVGEDFGHALHIDLIPTKGATDSKAMIGFNWGRPSSWPDTWEVYRDLSAADTLFFDAKGNGTLRVQFVCRDRELISNAAFETKIRLDSDWKKFRLPISGFVAKSGSELNSALSWKEVNAHCKATVFAADGTVELWLDNIEIGGVRLSDIE